MKIKKFFIILLFISLFAGFNFEGQKSSNKREGNNAPENVVALVKKIVKDVSYRQSSEQSDWEIAKTGDRLNDGGEVKTGSKSLALVLFTDGSGLLRVRENSILHIYGTKKEKSMDKNTFIQKGLIGFEVNKQAPDEEFKFTTPTVVASIRGTSGFLEYSDQDSTFTLFLSTGSAGIYSESDCDSVSAGNTIVIKSNGQCISRPQSLDDIKTYNATNQTNIKSININTNKGNVEIKYYGPKN